MKNRSYCETCNVPTLDFKKGGVLTCPECGNSKVLEKKEASIETLSKLVGWMFLIGWLGFFLFAILWFFG